MKCPHCAAETSGEYNFCIACDKQIKCLNTLCGKVLVPGKVFCFSCGQSLLTTNGLSLQPNKYIRDVAQEGENYKEHVEFSISDLAVSELAPFVVGQIISPSSRRVYNRAIIEETPNKTLIADTTQTEVEVQASAVSEQEGVPEQFISSSGATRYFERDGDSLVSREKDFKGKNWADQQRHFITLYASAYFDAFQKPVPTEEHFKDVSKKVGGLYDASNFSKHLGKSLNEHFSKLSEGYKLNDRGQKEVVRILTLMENEKSASGYQYWARTPNVSVKRHRMSKEDEAKVESWAAEKVDLGSLDTRNIKAARDYAMVSIWIITVHLKKASSVRWNDAYHYFKKKYSAMSASPEAFSLAVRKDTNKEFFRQSDELFYLSSEGVKKVEGWVTGKSVSPSNVSE